MARWSLRFRVFLFFAFLAGASVALIAGGLWFGWSRATPRPDMGPFVLGGIVASFAITAVIAWIWRLFDENLAHPMQALAAQMRVLAEGKGGTPLPEKEAQYLGDLAPAAKAIAARLSETQTDLTLAIRRETQSLAEEKERLEALLADVGVGVVLCTADHAVVFYNSLARGQLEVCTAPRLDQPITQCLREGPILQAHAQLTLEGSRRDEAEFTVTTHDGSAMFAAHMRLVPLGNDRAGAYVLTLRDVTAESGATMARESLLSDMVDDMRRRAAGLETLVALQEGPPEAPLMAALVDETHGFAGSVGRFAARFEENRCAVLEGRSISARDLADGTAARIRSTDLGCDTSFEDVTVSADGVMLVALLAHLTDKLRARFDLSRITLHVQAEPSGALVQLGWTGPALDMSDLEKWLSEELEMGEGAFPARYVLSRHGTEIWPSHAGTQGALMLPLKATAPRTDHVLRGAVYDFSLFEKSRMASLADMPLDDLSYVVFDTETTGLLPTQGDEIVQIAALRLMGQKIVDAEALDQLVNPGRQIPPASTKIHGITDDMVAAAPDIARAGAKMHDFSKGAVLVAHNAPFDMAFFHKHAAAIGKEFDNPVLDTVLLSAVLWGITEKHTLDALCDRLAIEIPPHLRHTAMGDTRATAEAFSQMLGMLKARGYDTFGAVHGEMKKHMRLYRGRQI